MFLLRVAGSHVGMVAVHHDGCFAEGSDAVGDALILAKHIPNLQAKGGGKGRLRACLRHATQ
jgi:hypothetical protein